MCGAIDSQLRQNYDEPRQQSATPGAIDEETVEALGLY